MKIEATPKEIAYLILQLQGQPKIKIDEDEFTKIIRNSIMSKSVTPHSQK